MLGNKKRYEAKYDLEQNYFDILGKKKKNLFPSNDLSYCW
jgi:hypothetical protein